MDMSVEDLKRRRKRRYMSTTENTVLSQLAAAIAARKDSLEKLRERIQKLIEPLPVGVLLADDEGEIGKIRSVCTGASQRGNRLWEVTINGKGLIANGKLVAETCARTYFEGDKTYHHSGDKTYHHSTEPFCLDTPDREELSWLSDCETRALAIRVPRAIARYIEECQEEEAANQKTVEMLDQQAPSRY
jgi:hypothetical protein